MRKNGVLLHISSLPSPYGIGTLGKDAYDFVDFLERTGQSIWQVLPLCPTGYGDSPYASYSTFAGNPYFIDLDLLAKDGLLKEEEFKSIDWGDQDDAVDYGKLYNNRFKVLAKAVERFKAHPDEEYETFLMENGDWLEDYTLFRALKDANAGKPWLEWDEEYRRYNPQKAKVWAKQYADKMEYYKILQYLFFKQWNALRQYANAQGVQIIGDIPIYVAMDSADAWAHPELFQLGGDNLPTAVAGCPPDGFAADGQLWGNPLYDWKYHKKTGYDWWIRRIDHLAHVYDILRIDHFRGFDSFYSIPYGAENAKVGEWLQGPGIDLFKTMEKKLGKLPIVAEDLGFLTDSVKELLAESGFPGMKILEFAFDSRDESGSEYLPYNYPKNSIAYAGTHDNDTIRGWFETISPEDKQFACDFMNAYNPDEYNWEMMRTVVASPADTAILQAQDLLNLGSEARMNVPGRTGGNWVWRMKPHALNEDIEGNLKYVTRLYGRMPRKKKAAAAKPENENLRQAEAAAEAAKR